MAIKDFSWTEAAGDIEGPRFERFQSELAKYNSRQLQPAFPTRAWRDELDEYGRVSLAEGEYIEAVRCEISPLVVNEPTNVNDFIDWF